MCPLLWPLRLEQKAGMRGEGCRDSQTDRGLGAAAEQGAEEGAHTGLRRPQGHHSWGSRCQPSLARPLGCKCLIPGAPGSVGRAGLQLSPACFIVALVPGDTCASVLTFSLLGVAALWKWPQCGMNSGLCAWSHMAVVTPWPPCVLRTVQCLQSGCVAAKPQLPETCAFLPLLVSGLCEHYIYLQTYGNAG